MTVTSSSGDKVPVLLLKTKSTPGDAYEELFSASHDGHSFAPMFVPVLQHSFDEQGLSSVRTKLEEGSISAEPGASFGGLIFTSQRAVEAFTKLVKELTSSTSAANLSKIPTYSVGPATTRALAAVPCSPPLNVHGSHTGIGDALAAFILDDYATRVYFSRVPKPPLLFLVGEQRRDIIPRTLMDPGLPQDRRIEVVETIVYGTGVMPSFKEDFDRALTETRMGGVQGKGAKESGAQTVRTPSRWVVVFSPTGCDGMLRGLGILDEATGRAKPESDGEPRTTFVATIGPTTRDHLRKTFGFEPEVCAEKPTPEGVRDGIVKFMESR